MLDTSVARKLTCEEAKSIIDRQQCPICGTEDSIGWGPSGGLAQNVRCDCGAYFNVSKFAFGRHNPGQYWGEYTHDDEPLVQAARDARKNKRTISSQRPKTVLERLFGIRF
jgi:hypothetical protein